MKNKVIRFLNMVVSILRNPLLRELWSSSFVINIKGLGTYKYTDANSLRVKATKLPLIIDKSNFD